MTEEECSNKTNEDLIEFAKEQCVIFPEDSDMGKYLRETIEILEDRMLAKSFEDTMWISYEILLEKIKQAREEVAKYQSIHDSYCEHIEKGIVGKDIHLTIMNLAEAKLQLMTICCRFSIS